MIYDYLILGRDLSMKLGLYSFSEMPSNIIGTITIFALLLALSRLQEETKTGRRITLVICLCILATATLAAQTRSAVIALMISLALLFSGNRKAVAVLFCVLILAVAVLPVKNILTMKAIREKIMADHRLQIWQMYGEIIKEYPVTGIGFGMQTSYDDALLAKYNARLPRERRLTILYKAPHNLLVDTAVRGGMVGLLLFLYIIVVFIRMGIRNIRKGRNDFIRNWGQCLIAAFTAFFIQGFFENVLSGPPAIVLYTILGMMTILWRINGETPEAL
jgi:O-antigen ligase